MAGLWFRGRWIEDNLVAIQVTAATVPDDARLAVLEPGEREPICRAGQTPESLLIIY